MAEPALATILDHASRRLAENLGIARAFARRFPTTKRDEGTVSIAPPSSPEALGTWLEVLRSDQRAQSFDDLLRAGRRHDGTSDVTTTQRFTPRWLASWLVESSARACHPDLRTGPAIDPACGGGHLLVALFDDLVSRGIPARDVLHNRLYGWDIDPLAAEIAARVLWLHACSRDKTDDLPRPRVGSPSEISAATDDGLGSLSPRWLHDMQAQGWPAQWTRVVTNPPYMSSRHLAPAIRRQLRQHYAAFAGDLYTAFLRRCVDLASPGGSAAILCQQSFLFLKRDRELRRKLFAAVTPREMLHLGPHAFPRIGGEKTSVVALAMTKRTADAEDEDAFSVIDLADLKTPDDKRRVYQATTPDPHHNRRYDASSALQRARAGRPLAYWWPPRLDRVLDLKDRLGETLDVPGTPHKTGDNARFLRRWFEIPRAERGSGRWKPYAKGGPHRKWAGNLDHVIDWSVDAQSFYRDNRNSSLMPERWRFAEGLTWSDLGGQAFSLRWLPAGSLYDMAGPALFVPDDAPGDLWFWLGLLNSQIVCHLLNADNGTIHYQVGNLRNLPIPGLRTLREHPATHTIRQATLRAVEATVGLDACRPTSAGFQRPLLASVGPADSLAELVSRATKIHGQLCQTILWAQTAVDAAALELYGATGSDLAAIDARIPRRRPTYPLALDVQTLVRQAQIYVVGVARGAFVEKDDESNLEVDAIGQRVFGRAWPELTTTGWQDPATLATSIAAIYGPRRMADLSE